MQKKSWIILGLIGLVVIALIAIGFAGPSEKAEYVGVKKCKMCHADAFKTYEIQGHAKAWDSLSADEKKKPECIKCHVTGYSKPGGYSDDSTTPDMVNVQCESCHGPGSEHIKAPKDQKKATINRDVGAVCITCHNPHVRFGKK
jgi:hypothetical protein